MLSPSGLVQAAAVRDALLVLTLLGDSRTTGLEKVSALEAAMTNSPLETQSAATDDSRTQEMRHTCARARRLIVQVLLLEGADPDDPGPSGWSATEKTRMGFGERDVVADFVKDGGVAWIQAKEALQQPVRDGLAGWLVEHGFTLRPEVPQVARPQEQAIQTNNRTVRYTPPVQGRSESPPSRSSLSTSPPATTNADLRSSMSRGATKTDLPLLDLATPAHRQPPTLFVGGLSSRVDLQTISSRLSSILLSILSPSDLIYLSVDHQVTSVGRSASVVLANTIDIPTLVPALHKLPAFLDLGAPSGIAFARRYDPSIDSRTKRVTEVSLDSRTMWLGGLDDAESRSDDDVRTEILNALPHSISRATVGQITIKTSMNHIGQICAWVPFASEKDLLDAISRFSIKRLGGKRVFPKVWRPREISEESNPVDEKDWVRQPKRPHEPHGGGTNSATRGETMGEANQKRAKLDPLPPGCNPPMANLQRSTQSHQLPRSRQTAEQRRLAALIPSARSPSIGIKIFEPLPTPPAGDFKRELPIPVSFGFVPTEAANAALRLQSSKPEFEGEEQLAFEHFLRAQAGESYAHYDELLVFLAEFGRENEEFARMANSVTGSNAS